MPTVTISAAICENNQDARERQAGLHVKFSDIFKNDAASRKRKRVIKALVLPRMQSATNLDSASYVVSDTATRARMRASAKELMFSALMDGVIPYKETGGDVSSYQYDVISLFDRKRLQAGTISERAYIARMATGAWREVEELAKQGES